MLINSEEKIQQEKFAILQKYNSANVLKNASSPPVNVAPEKPSGPAPVPAATQIPMSKVTDRDTMIYQLDHILRPLRQIELHLSEGCKINDKACDCCVKSSSDIINFSDETIPIAARSGVSPEIFHDLSQWAQKIERITAPNNRVDETIMRQESGEASTKRKLIQAMLDKFRIEENQP